MSHECHLLLAVGCSEVEGTICSTLKGPDCCTLWPLHLSVLIDFLCPLLLCNQQLLL